MNLPKTIRHRPPAQELITQFVLIAGAALVYFSVRGLTQGNVDQAKANAEAVLRLEHRLGIDLETDVQRSVLDRRWLVTLVNWVYIWGHWPVIAMTLFILHRQRSPHFLLMRNAIFVSGALGIVVFILFPVMPPRLLDGRYTDTVTSLSTSYRVFQPPGLVNKYAAMPSLHMGWNLLAGIAVFQASRHIALKAFAVLSPMAMMFAVVATANHFILDAIVGSVFGLAGLLVAEGLWRVYYAPRVITDPADSRTETDAQPGGGGPPGGSNDPDVSGDSGLPCPDQVNV